LSTALSMPQASPMATPPAAPGPLTKRQKAAIIVRLMIAEDVTVPLTGLPGRLQTELIHQMAGLRHGDQRTLMAVIAESN